MVVKSLTSLGRLGCKIFVEEQKWVYFNSAKLVYDGMLYAVMKTLWKSSLVTLAQNVVVVKTELRNKGIDPDFSRRYTESNWSRKPNEPIQEILSLANNYDDFISDSSQIVEA